MLLRQINRHTREKNISVSQLLERVQYFEQSDIGVLRDSWKRSVVVKGLAAASGRYRATIETPRPPSRVYASSLYRPSTVLDSLLFWGPIQPLAAVRRQDRRPTGTNQDDRTEGHQWQHRSATRLPNCRVFVRANTSPFRRVDYIEPILEFVALCSIYSWVFSYLPRSPVALLCARTRLELRRLHTDLIWCYKIVFGMVDLKFDEFFEWNPRCGIEDTNINCIKKSTNTRVRSEYFSERVITAWNGLAIGTDFDLLLVLRTVF